MIQSTNTEYDPYIDPDTSKQLVIGICGKAGAGKDTIAMQLQTEYAMKRYAFADPLKEAAAKMFGIGIDRFHDRSTKELDIEYWKKSPRTIAQDVGMFVRNNLGKDFWIRRLEYEMLLHPVARICISDVRFQNEVEWITKKPYGFILNIARPGFEQSEMKEENRYHISEISPLSFDPNYTYAIINDGTINELFQKVGIIMEQITERVAGSILADESSFINTQI